VTLRKTLVPAPMAVTPTMLETPSPAGRRSPNLMSGRSGSPFSPLRGARLSPRTLKVLALGYSLKIILLGLVCLMIPDLPARAMSKARQLWMAVGGPSTR
jgi:hypothetical protein